MVSQAPGLLSIAPHLLFKSPGHEKNTIKGNTRVTQTHKKKVTDNPPCAVCSKGYQMSNRYTIDNAESLLRGLPRNYSSIPSIRACLQKNCLN